MSARNSKFTRTLQLNSQTQLWTWNIALKNLVRQNYVKCILFLTVIYQSDIFLRRSSVMLYLASSPSRTTVKKKPISSSRLFTDSKNVGLTMTSNAVQPLPPTTRLHDIYTMENVISWPSRHEWIKNKSTYLVTMPQIQLSVDKCARL